MADRLFSDSGQISSKSAESHTLAGARKQIDLGIIYFDSFLVIAFGLAAFLRFKNIPVGRKRLFVIFLSTIFLSETF